MGVPVDDWKSRWPSALEDAAAAVERAAHEAKIQVLVNYETHLVSQQSGGLRFDRTKTQLEKFGKLSCMMATVARKKSMGWTGVFSHGCSDPKTERRRCAL